MQSVSLGVRLMKDIQMLYNWATSAGPNSTSSREILLSLWDGDRYRMNLQDVLNYDEHMYHTLRTVVAHLYVHKQQITDHIGDLEMRELVNRLDVCE
jgi:DNA-binding MarR family transcriptional regulator